MVRAARLDGVDPREAVQEEPHPVPRDRHVLAVRKAQHPPPGADLDADDAVREAADVRDAGDDYGRPRDRATGGDTPPDPAGRGRDAVEPAVVGTEAHDPV